MTSLEAAAGQAAKGDGRAFEAVCRALQDDVWRYCYALASDPELAAEAGRPLRHCPSGKFAANAAWLLAATLQFGNFNDAGSDETADCWDAIGRWPGGPLVRVVDSVEIDRPASLVWAYVADYGNDTSWRAAVTQMRPSVPGPAQVGVTTHELLRLVGMIFRTDTTIERVEAGRLLQWRAHDRQKQLHGARLVEPTGPHAPSPRWSRVAYSVSRGRWSRRWRRPAPLRSQGPVLRRGTQSARGSQSSQRDRDEPADRSLGWQATGCAEGVEAVRGELVRRDVVPEVAGRCDLGQQVLDQVVDVLLRPGEVRSPMQEGGEFGAGVLV